MITTGQLVELGEAAGKLGSASALRQQFPALHFSECSDDDVSPRYKAALNIPGYALYYISGATGHCLEMTNDPAIATGILLAATVDDE